MACSNSLIISEFLGRHNRAEMQEIESKVLAKIGSFRKTGRILREEIFSILEDEATLLNILRQLKIIQKTLVN